MKVAVVDRHFGHVSYDLGLWQRLSLFLFGYAKLCSWAKEGWTGELPFYIVKCEKHGYFVDYVHGHRRYFSCPKCDDETVQSWASQAKALNA